MTHARQTALSRLLPVRAWWVLGLWLGLTTGTAHAQATALVIEAASPYWGTARPGSLYTVTVPLRGTIQSSAELVAELRAVDGTGKALAEAPASALLPTTQPAHTQRLLMSMRIPNALADGEYRLEVSVRPRTEPGHLLTLGRGERVSEANAGAKAYTVGHLVVTRRDLKAADLKCAGQDETAALNAALASLTAGQTLLLPAGACRYSSMLNLKGKSDVQVAGAGRDETILLASNPQRSAFVVSRANQIVIRDLSVRSQTPLSRQTHADANGLYVEHSQQVRLLRNRVDGVAAAGIVLWRVRQADVTDNEVQNTQADGIHVTGGAKDILVANNQARDTGDDGFSSIGYQREQAEVGLNERITIRDNRSVNSWASGVSVEGSTDVTVSGNVIEASGVAGLRIASIGSEWNTGAVNRVTASGNVLRGVRTRADVDHAAIMIFADRDNVSHITLSGNRIEEPLTSDAIRVRGKPLAGLRASHVRVDGTAILDSRGRVRNCLAVGAATDDVQGTSNRLNGAPCP